MLRPTTELVMTVLDTPVAVWRVAVELLARREYGRVELTRKLCQRGASSELINSTLDRLIKEGLLNESRYLESFIASRVRSGYGPLRIREELVQRGLPRGEIERVLKACDVDWNTQLHEVWYRKFGRLPIDAKEKAHQGRFLVYRGYSTEAINYLLYGHNDD